jgi:hypothetical protein
MFRFTIRDWIWLAVLIVVLAISGMQCRIQESEIRGLQFTNDNLHKYYEEKLERAGLPTGPSPTQPPVPIDKRP